MNNIGIVIDLNREGGGTFQWTVNILHALKYFKDNTENTSIYVYFYPNSEGIADLTDLFPQFHFIKIGIISYNTERILRRVIFTIPLFLHPAKVLYPLNRFTKRHRLDLMIFPGASLAASLYVGKQAFLFTDISHEFHPEFPEVSANGELYRRRMIFLNGIKNSDIVIVESNQLCGDIQNIYGAKQSKIEVLYQSLPQKVLNNDEIQDNLDGFINTITAPFIYYPAQLWAHKNHTNLLHALVIVIKNHPDLLLVLTGSRKEGDESIFTSISKLGLKNNVVYLGYVSDRTKEHLYKMAKCLIMPTYFGPTNIPTLEAFHYGCPAVISDIPGVKEQVGEAALLFNPSSPSEMADSICAVLNDGQLASNLVALGKDRINYLSFDNYQIRFANIIKKHLGLINETVE